MEANKNTCNSDKCIKGIVCSVKNCVYHDHGDHCTAKQISVGPGYAVSSTDTLCATFKQNTEA